MLLALATQSWEILTHVFILLMMTVEQETIKEPSHPQQAVFSPLKITGWGIFVYIFGNKIVAHPSWR